MKTQYSLAKAIRHCIEHARPAPDGVEGEVHNSLEPQLREIAGYQSGGFAVPFAAFRALEAGVAEEGGYAVGEDVGRFVDVLRNRAIVADLGATALSGLRSNVRIPRLNSDQAASWVDEEGSVSDSSPTLGQILLQPKRLSRTITISNQLLIQAPEAETMVRGAIAKSFGIAIDSAAIFGAGSGNEPQGVTLADNVNTITFGAAATFAKVIEMETEVASDNGIVNPGTVAYATSPAAVAKWKAKSVVGSEAKFLWENGMVNSHRAVSSNQLTGNIAIFGDWSQIVIGSWGPAMTLIVDPYSAAQTGQTKITASAYVDVCTLHGESFCVSTDSAAQ